MQSDPFHKILMTLVIILLSVTFFSSAQAGWWSSKEKVQPIRRIEVDMDWIFGQSLAFKNNTESTTLKLNDGFRITVAYGNKVFIGLSLTSYASGSIGDNSISRTRLSIPLYIETPWMKFWNREFATCRGKAGFLIDPFGLETQFSSQADKKLDKGRLREQLAFFSFEVAPLVFEEGYMCIRFAYARSIFGYSTDGSDNHHDFDSGGNNHLFIGLGASVTL